jgi:hypothetical protein
MNRYAILGALLLASTSFSAARAQAVVEDPGYCAQFYPNANCQNYGPGNPLYPGSWVPAGPPGLAYAPGGYAVVPYHHVHRHYRHHQG